MFTGMVRFDVLLPEDVRALKGKRLYARPVLAALRRIEVAAAEVDFLDLHGRAIIGVATVAADVGHVTEVLDSCERAVAARPELTLLEARRRIYGDDD